MKKILKILTFILLSGLFPSSVLASPNIVSVTGIITDGQSVTIEGEGFGVKNNVAPIKFTDFDSDIVGQVPSGWLSPQGTDCQVNNSVYRGSKSLDCGAVNWMGAEYFPRITLDMNRNIGTSTYLYFSAWLYMSDPGMQINWKGPLLTSSLTPTYWVNTSPTTNSATGVGAWWFVPEARWGNTSITIQYSQNNTATFNYCSAGNGVSADAYLYGQWQRIDYTIKTSSSPAANDAYVKVERIGKGVPMTNATGCVTHGNTSDPWRYFSLPQGITNIPTTPFNMQMNFDDLYIDDSLARVEICDSSTWTARTHCEIQKPTTWSNISATINFNQGTFGNNTDVFLYVVDGSGEVNANGYPINIRSGDVDSTVPSSPSGILVT